ncbi:MAG: hypothetical protein ACREYE_20895 [Gammaproteobacteria bacterium]
MFDLFYLVFAFLILALGLLAYLDDKVQRVRRQDKVIRRPGGNRYHGEREF